MLIHPLRRNRSDPCRSTARAPPCVTPRGSRISATHASKTSTLRRLSGERRMRSSCHQPTGRRQLRCRAVQRPHHGWYGQSLVCRRPRDQRRPNRPCRARGGIGKCTRRPAHRCHRGGRPRSDHRPPVLLSVSTPTIVPPLPPQLWPEPPPPPPPPSNPNRPYVIGLAVAAHMGVIPKTTADRVLRVTSRATAFVEGIMGPARPAAPKHKATP